MELSINGHRVFPIGNSRQSITTLDNSFQGAIYWQVANGWCLVQLSDVRRSSTGSALKLTDKLPYAKSSWWTGVFPGVLSCWIDGSGLYCNYTSANSWVTLEFIYPVLDNWHE